MRHGCLVRLTHRPIALALAALAVGLLLAPLPRAAARLDPLQIVNAQIVRPNILIVLDTSGSMSWRPSDQTNVGGDCYQGQNCVNATANQCADGSSCSPANTCQNGTTACTPGVMSYCTNGSACSTGMVCPTTHTLCGGATCRDGSACSNTCTYGTNVLCGGSNPACPSNTCSGATCPSGTCNTSTGVCQGTGIPYCGTFSNHSNRCSTATDTTCTKSGGVYVPTNCPGYYCTANSGTCSLSGSPCDQDSDCPANSCSAANKGCAASTGSTTCGSWCDSSGSGAACVSQKYCASGGLALDCAQECSSGQCYAAPHCGAAACSGVSSRLAIAKHTISDLISQTSNVANFGLMSFNERRFFPYLHTSGATTTTIHREVYFSNGELLGHHQAGWDRINDRPKAQFTQGGITYTIECSAAGGPTFSPCDNSLGTAGNARYHRGWTNARHDYCGRQCRFDGHQWEFRGAYYTYTQTVTSGGTTTLSYYPNPDLSTGADWPGPCLDSSWNPVADCSTAYYRYFQYDSDYWNHINMYGYTCGAMDTPVCGTTSGPSASCDTYDTLGANHLAAGRLLVPLSTSSASSDQNAKVAAIQKWLAPQNTGGLVATGATPTGCTLQFAGGATTPADSSHDAYNYLASVKTTDPLQTNGNACRNTYVILVTDGEATGPGDSNCGSSACATDPTSCGCMSTKSAYHLWNTLGVKTFVIGFGADTAGANSLDYIAKAGGSALKSDGHYAYYAADEDSLSAALQNAVYLAVQGDYATTPPTVATSSGQSVAGNVGLVTSTEFPSFKGHLRAYDLVNLTAGNPTLLWDAGQKIMDRIGASGVNWNRRRVYTSDANNALVPFLDSGGNPNGAALNALSPPLGGSPAEANAIVQWTLGLNRTWVLGSLLNSTPATHGKGLDINLPGHKDFYDAHSYNRPKMIYVGSDDGMLHAFYFETGAWGNAGDEAWAYVPPSLLPALASLYATPGEPQSPALHIYGIASSPKVYDVCTGACASASDWKTVLIGGEGAGGATYYALDISAIPQTPSGYDADPPFTVLWQSGDASNATHYAPGLGQTWSVPAFSFVGSGTTTSVNSFGSGYDPVLSDANDQGAWLFTATPTTGAAYAADRHLAAPASGLETDYALLADTAVAVDPTTSLNTIAAYQVDLAGRLWRAADGTGTPAVLYSAPGTPTQHPFYYSPAVMVMTGRNVMLALADSTYDDPDMNDTTAFTPNLTVIFDNDGTLQTLTMRGASGTTYTSAVPLTDVCRDTCHNGNCTGCTKFTAAARPIGSPLLIQNDATGKYEALFLIYQPSASSCSLGHSYLVVLDVDQNPVVQSQALDAGAGKASGLTIGGGGALMVGTSGTGSSPSMLKIVTGSVGSGAPVGTSVYARMLGVVEKD
jgi:hypothetical protein